MRQVRRLCEQSVVLAACCLLSGCGKPPPPEPVEVKGRVILPAEVKPGTFLLLQFHAADETARGSRSDGRIEEDGTFTVQCIPGKYRVAITAVGTGGDAAAGPTVGNPAISPQQLGIPAAYGRPTTTPLEVVVPPEGRRDVELVVK
jgi:hypothetical protein